MLYRYKIKKHEEGLFGALWPVTYEVVIQKYNEHKTLFKWDLYEETDMLHIVRTLGIDTYGGKYHDNIEEVYDGIMKYGGVDKTISEYIGLTNVEKHKDDERWKKKEAIDKMLLGRKWNHIEI